MYARIVTVSHVWPGITPWTVWDLPWDMWVGFARAADEWVQARREGRSDESD